MLNIIKFKGMILLCLLASLVAKINSNGIYRNCSISRHVHVSFGNMVVCRSIAQCKSRAANDIILK